MHSRNLVPVETIYSLHSFNLFLLHLLQCQCLYIQSESQTILPTLLPFSFPSSNNLTSSRQEISFPVSPCSGSSPVALLHASSSKAEVSGPVVSLCSNHPRFSTIHVAFMNLVMSRVRLELSAKRKCSTGLGLKLAGASQSA